MLPGLPQLPPLPPGIPQGRLKEGFLLINDIFTSASRFLAQDGADPLRLNAHAALIQDEALRLLDAAEPLLPQEWVADVRSRLTFLHVSLCTAATESTHDACVAIIQFSTSALPTLTVRYP